MSLSGLTGKLQIPHGNIANLPTSFKALEGLLVWDEDSQQVFIANGSAFVPVGGPGTGAITAVSVEGVVTSPVSTSGVMTTSFGTAALATNLIAGIVKPDGTTTKVVDGVITATIGQEGFPDEPALTVFAGPLAGFVAQPTFRALTSADLPLATSGLAGAIIPDG